MWSNTEVDVNTLIGHRVVSVDNDLATLDDGRVLRFHGNEGCGGCASGWYDLVDLQTCDNIITNVYVTEPVEDEYGLCHGTYRIFVFADNQAINLATFEGDDGNGYYGTGFWIEVVDA